MLADSVVYLEIVLLLQQYPFQRSPSSRKRPHGFKTGSFSSLQLCSLAPAL
jgi:hypothetical protein